MKLEEFELVAVIEANCAKLAHMTDEGFPPLELRRVIERITELINLLPADRRPEREGMSLQ